MAFLSLAQTRLTQDAVRSVLGVDSSGMSGESFTQRLEHVLKHAIGDKNREIYHLNEELKALRFELSKREKQIEMLHDIKRGSSSSLPSAPAPAARKETILTDDRRIIGESSRVRWTRSLSWSCSSRSSRSSSAYETNRPSNPHSNLVLVYIHVVACIQPWCHQEAAAC